jgi:hypothetical protein
LTAAKLRDHAPTNVGADAGGVSVRDDLLYYAVVVGSGVVSVVIFALVVFDVMR